MAANIAEITLRQMTPADIPFGLQLSTAAGWNQNAADWQLILSQKGATGFLASLDGVPAGTVTVIPYQDRFSWVGMALVSVEFQRRGIGTALLNAAVEEGLQSGLVRLDATPSGKKLYEGLGFRDEYLLSRLRRIARPGETPWQSAPESTCQPISADLFPGILQFDYPVFGADRLSILTGLHQIAPQFGFAWIESSIIKGYCLGRVGVRFAHIGPIIAEDFKVAQGLLLQSLNQCDLQDVILDVPQQNVDWLAFLSALGFAELRPFIRMCFGSQDLPEQNPRQYAIAGPELG